MEANGGIRTRFMWKLYEPWQVAMLSRLGTVDSERLESYLNTLWEQFPNLYESIAIGAVDQEELTLTHCAECLGITAEEVEGKLRDFRQSDRFRQQPIARAVVAVQQDSPAKLVHGQIAVWEVVREYRKLGSLERLTEAFPGIRPFEIAEAMKYAEQNPKEIATQIELYETMLARRRAEYPFSK